MRLIKENNALLSVIALLFVLSLGATAESYKGSQAYNHEKLFKAQVNIATGTFSFSYPLIEISGIREPLKLHLNYHFNAVGMFGLPTGWRLDLDFISDKTAELGGKQWLIDDLWHDETGYASGLKYYNQHGNRFDDLVEARSIPRFPSMSYRYKTHHKDGSIQYFSHQGLIVLRIDRFGNSIKFSFEKPIRELELARLNEIVDNYGNRYQFNYEPNTIIIHYPDGREQRIYFNKQGVTEIINPLRQSYHLTYISSFGRDLLRTIESPEGLMTELGYDSIPYKKDESIKQLPVVIHFKQFDLADKKIQHEVNYLYSKGNNYTGYPLYSLSDSSDSLIESDNQAYTYSVEVSRVNDKQVHHQVYEYNYLHLPVEIRTSNEGRPHTKVTYDYDISPFKYSRSTNYDKPVRVTKAVWHPSRSSYVPSDRIETTFDLYGNKLMEVHSVYNQDTGKWVRLKRVNRSYFTENFSLISEKIEEDLQGGRAIAKQFRLDSSGKTHAIEEQRFKVGVKQKNWTAWQKVDYTHDDQGRERSTKTSWLIEGKSGVQEISQTKTYVFDKKSAELTLTKASNAGRTITHIIDTRNDRLIKFISPEDEVTQYKYDALNREITVIDALGNSIKTTYETYCQDGKNTQLHQSPLGEKRRTTLDASNRIVEHQDQYKGHWRTLLRQSYNAYGKVISKTNKIGLTTSSTYDEQERLIQAIDIWKNKYEISYDDEKLTTTISMNGQRNQLKRKIPWERKEIHAMFPFLNNVYDKPAQYMEMHWVKDGFNKTIEAESSLVDLTSKNKSETVLAGYKYDAQNNRVLSKIETYDGIVLTKTSEYDLSNKLFTWKKSYHSDNKHSTHEGYRYHYDADGLLTKVESPFIKGAHHDIFNYRYDKNGREIVRTLQDGNKISYEYDERGLLVQRSWYRNKKRYSINHHFDADGKLVTLEDSDNQLLHFRYSNTGQLIEMRYPDNRSLSFELDKYDRVIHQTDANGVAQGFTYLPSDKGKLSDITLGNSHICFHYGKDGNGCKGQLIGRQFEGAGTGLTQSNYQYDAFRRLKRSMNINHSSQRSFQVDYSHNAWGEMHSQRQKLTTKDREEWLLTNYEYDGLRRLNKETQGYSMEGKPFQHWHNAFLYDGNNNIICETKLDVNGCLAKKTYRYNAQDQLVNITIDGSENRIPIIYDTNGRLINDHYGSIYSYDNAGYLLKITDKKLVETYLNYLPNGFLGQSFHQGAHSDFYPNEYQQVTTLYKDNEWHSLVRMKHSIIGISNDRGIDQMFKANQTTSAVLALTEAGNTRLDLLYYDAYGKQTGFSAADKSPIESFGWNQELTETNVGLTYLRHRFYHPGLRRFITRDSFDVDNRYAYTSGNPVNTMDPTGHNEAVNYSVGGGFSVLGVIGAIFAVPTGGASLSLSAAAGIGAGVTTALSGISLMGSQMALDAGNKVAAKALSITSITLGSLAMAQGVISLAPTIGSLLMNAGQYFTTSSGVIEESAGAVSATANVTGEEEMASSGRLEVAGTANTGTGAASAATTTAIGEEMASPAVEFLHSGLAEHSVGTMIERLGESGEGKVTHFTSMNSNFHKMVVHQQATWVAKIRDFLFKRMVDEDFAYYMSRDGGGAKILYAEDDPNKLKSSQRKGLFEYFGLPSAETIEGAVYYKALQRF